MTGRELFVLELGDRVTWALAVENGPSPFWAGRAVTWRATATAKPRP